MYLNVCLHACICVCIYVCTYVLYQDEEGAGPIPIPRLGFKATERLQPSNATNTCSKCNREAASQHWRFCAYCGSDLRANALVAATPSSLASTPSTRGVSVELRDVYFHYPSQPAARGLKGVSVVCPAGTTTAFVGHTGAGWVNRL
jgi:ABC-type multidrug transport system fused ATPase/permease subunit